MKKISFFYITILAFAFLFINPNTVKAQEKKKTETVQIQSSVVCGMCEKTIKRELLFEKGISNVQVNTAKKLITVDYRPKKTNVNKIKTAITKIGYDADDMIADEKAYQKLPDCCKQDAADPH